jgi:hypothetical protein
MKEVLVEPKAKVEPEVEVVWVEPENPREKTD